MNARTPFGHARVAYTVQHEAWHADPGQQRAINVYATGPHGGRAWELEISDHHLSGPCIKVEIFGPSLNALVEIPEFFTYLRETNPTSVDDVIGTLKVMGAVDNTDRQRRSIR